jgi:hypothetical protein
MIQKKTPESSFRIVALKPNVEGITFDVIPGNRQVQSLIL